VVLKRMVMFCWLLMGMVPFWGLRECQVWGWMISRSSSQPEAPWVSSEVGTPPTVKWKLE